MSWGGEGIEKEGGKLLIVYSSAVSTPSFVMSTLFSVPQVLGAKEVFVLWKNDLVSSNSVTYIAESA